MLPNFEFVVYIYFIGVWVVINFCHFEFSFACLFVFLLPDLKNLNFSAFVPSTNPFLLSFLCNKVMKSFFSRDNFAESEPFWDLVQTIKPLQKTIYFGV